ncbi:glycosyltransferase family 2 protein [Flavobacterium faecale]|uniref:glycosyltransferase family 2 protein n=1 Tax=Flavobacterium faecale TaxID=1355330 RepID=UPI003AB0C052
MSIKKISVIVPCYNQAHYLNEALESIYQQTYSYWECIVVNDGSTDITEEIVQKWISIDNRFSYIKKENGGLSSARNSGLRVTTGDYIQFLDADDYLNKYKFEYQLKCFGNDNTDLVICDYFPFNQKTGAFHRGRYMSPFLDLNNYKYDIVLKWERGISIPCHCILFKRELLEQNTTILFDESLPNHEDWAFWVKIFYFSKGISIVKESLVGYRIHNSSMCSDVELMNKGFVKACEANISFFESLNDIKMTNICNDKLIILLGKDKFNLKKFLKLFIPPILLILKQKIVKKNV